ncbi:MAG: winged helix-turn-helix transcriptional regulator [Vampirovibrionales bacterium]
MTLLQPVLSPELCDELLKTESPLERALHVMGDRHSLLIIQSLRQFEPRRFLELQEQLPGISTRTLTKRLKMLEGVGILDRKQYMEMPPRVEYRLTDIGHALAKVIDPMMAWANTHFPYTPHTRG